ncbi:MAG TPA: 50S ribosomal protein L13 [Candidatus Nanoarchaeia archaeon]|nr:50S ribosomal protein L13 [Candidatus Nanoarchaeia archaeon]
MIIDATDLLLGRMASHAAKAALLGQQVDIVNCERAVISGRAKDIIARYRQRRERGYPYKGPFFPKQSDRLVRRTVRGMLPYKKEKGSSAFKRVMCWKGIPEQFKEKKMERFADCQADKLPNEQYMTIGQLCIHLGGK